VLSSAVHIGFLYQYVYYLHNVQTTIDPQFFTNELGFSHDDFVLIKSLSSWAICMFHHAITSPLSSNTQQQQQDISFMCGLDADQRAEIGYKCKRLLDMGRVRYLQQHGYDASLVYYADKNHSPENCMLVAVKK
jgi:Methyltransferase TRM13.